MPADPDMTALFFVMSPCPSGRGFECSRIFNKPADAIGAAQNVTGGQIWRQTMTPVTVTTVNGDVTLTRIDWAVHYVTPDPR